MKSSIAEYYQARAYEYERVYDKPERQEDLAKLRAWLAEEVRGRSVLEVACGTGYWTAVAAVTARTVLATDRNSAPLEIARAKGLGTHVTFAEADAFALPDYGVPFDAGMAHFWWSHVSLADQQRFLRHFASKLRGRAKLLMMDNNYVPGSSTPGLAHGCARKHLSGPHPPGRALLRGLEELSDDRRIAERLRRDMCHGRCLATPPLLGIERDPGVRRRRAQRLRPRGHGRRI